MIIAKVPGGFRGLLLPKSVLSHRDSAEVILRAPDVHNERTRELLRELAKVQTTDVRQDIWDKVQPAQ